MNNFPKILISLTLTGLLYSCTVQLYVQKVPDRYKKAQELMDQHDSTEYILISDTSKNNRGSGGKGRSPGNRKGHEENFTILQYKYANILGLDHDQIENEPLYLFIENWLGTPYELGGDDKNGIDCSALVQLLYYEVYEELLPGTVIAMFNSKEMDLFRGKKYLREGDLIFFRINKEDAVSHVGIYLNNDKFLNSSESKGVTISDLNQRYWNARFVAGGRLKIKNKK